MCHEAVILACYDEATGHEVNYSQGNEIMRTVVTDADVFNRTYKPRVAIIEGCKQSTKQVVDLLKKCDGKPMVIPRMLSDRLLASQGLDKKAITRIKRAKSMDDIREFEQQVAAATRMHLQYITRKLAFVDAVVLPGSRYDIPPNAYHDPKLHEATQVAPPVDVRFQTELVMADYALYTRKIPILGICGGMQLLVVKTGGRLIQHLPDYENVARHELENGSITQASQNGARWLAASSGNNDQAITLPLDATHSLKVIDAKSILGSILKDCDFDWESLKNSKNGLGVYSKHHQGATPADVNPRELKVTAVSETELVGAVEHVNHPFCLGVDFHPEYNESCIGSEMLREVVEFARFMKAPSVQSQPQQPHFTDWKDNYQESWAPQAVAQ